MAKYNSLTPDIADTLQAIVGKQRFFAGSAVKRCQTGLCA